MKKQILYLVLGLLAIVICIVGILFIQKTFTAKGDGSIQIEVVDVNEEIIKSKKITYNDGDTLVSLVEDNFDNVTITTGMLMTIETLTTPSDWSTFICIYINGEMSNEGINDLGFSDGDKISFIMTLNTYAG